MGQRPSAVGSCLVRFRMLIQPSGAWLRDALAPRIPNLFTIILRRLTLAIVDLD